VPKDSTIADVTPEALAGVTIGAQTSTTHANYAQEKFPESELKIYPSPDEYKLDMQNGRLDAAIDDVVVLDEWTKSEAGACCRILGVLPLDPVINGEGAGIGIRKEDTDLKEMFNKAPAGCIERHVCTVGAGPSDVRTSRPPRHRIDRLGR
jgi:polar amino acid transport system substrate-binding protein